MLFPPWGESPELPGEDLEIYAVVTAMEATDSWYQLQALRELAATIGLAPEAADQAVGRMVDGSTRRLLRRSSEALDRVPVRPQMEIGPGGVGAIVPRLREICSRGTSRPEAAHASAQDPLQSQLPQASRGSSAQIPSAGRSRRGRR